jgi:hypothetical protein
VVPIVDATEALSCTRSPNSSTILVPELANLLPQNAPQCTKPYARSRMQSSESVPFSVLSNKEISSPHPEETIRLKPSVSLPSIMSAGYHSSFPADQIKTEDPEDVSSEESLLSTPTQSHFELPQTVEAPKAPSTFSIFSYDVPSSRLDSRRTFLRTQPFRQ